MEVDELKAFLTIAESQSFSRAAQQLHLTQPAVSKRISQLESSLGCQLFDRVGRTVTLTESGKNLLPRAQKILMEIEDMRRALTNLSGEVSGRLKIGTSHHIGLHRLPPILKSFSRQYPEVLLDIQFIDSEKAFDLIMQSKIELGIVTLPPEDNSPLHTQAIWNDPLVFMIAADHPLSSQMEISLAELATFPAILPSMSTFTRRIVETIFQAHQLKINVPISTNYLETIKMMSSIGLGWTVLPATMLDSQVKILHVSGSPLARTLGVVYHPGHSLSNAAKAILDLLYSYGDDEYTSDI